MNRHLSTEKRRRRAGVMGALDDQLQSPETPQVREHYNRLRGLGHSEDDIRELMATVLLFYIWHTQRGDIYSYDDYVAELARLPEIDWHDDSDGSDIHT
jgi:hypothetical protein